MKGPLLPPSTLSDSAGIYSFLHPSLPPLNPEIALPAFRSYDIIKPQKLVKAPGEYPPAGLPSTLRAGFMHRIWALLSSCGGTSWLPGALPAQPLSPAPGAARPPPPVRWRYRLYNHVYRGEGGKKNDDNRNDPLIVRNAGSRPRGGQGGSDARRRDAPFPQGVPGLARTPRRLPGLGPRSHQSKVGGKRASGGPAEPSFLPGEHPLRNGEEAPAASQPEIWAKPTGSLLSLPCITSPFQKAAHAMYIA